VAQPAPEATGAGASFPAPLYAKWASDYHKATGVKINYQSVGSGAGLRQIEAKTVDFGASDAPLTDEDLAKKGLVQFPTVIGGVVPVVNIKGIAAGQLRLSGPVLGDIYLGKITRWNDAAIQALNPGLPLPDAAIAPVRRADGSGTSFIFTNYLSKVNAEWKARVGEGTAVNWPTGAGGKGNEGVAAFVGRLPNSIGYVEYAYVKQNKMAWRRCRTPKGSSWRPTTLTSRPPPPAPTGARASSDPHQPARQGRLAHHRRHLHPDAQEPGQARPGRRHAEVLPVGLQHGDGRRWRWTTCPCPRPSKA
jgi:phosphate transport system substrate-binding protein